VGRVPLGLSYTRNKSQDMVSTKVEAANTYYCWELSSRLVPVSPLTSDSDIRSPNLCRALCDDKSGPQMCISFNS
jgi:hypothetical protein